MKEKGIEFRKTYIPHVKIKKHLTNFPALKYFSQYFTN